MKLFGRNIISSVICKALVALQMITLAACDSFIYNDLALCDEGLRLRFVYDYNMEFANAFPWQVVRRKLADDARLAGRHLQAFGLWRHGLCGCLFCL